MLLYEGIVVSAVKRNALLCRDVYGRGFVCAEDIVKRLFLLRLYLVRLVEHKQQFLALGVLHDALRKPFTHGEIGVLMRKGQDDLLQLVNDIISQMKRDGSLRRLHEKYGLVYEY